MEMDADASTDAAHESDAPHAVALNPYRGVVDRIALSLQSSRPEAACASASASDELMECVSATEPGPRLPDVLWGEIGRFVTRNDILNLRTASKGMAKWIDTSD